MDKNLIVISLIFGVILFGMVLIIIRELSKGVFSTTCDYILTGLSNRHKHKASRSCIRRIKGLYKGSYVVYRDVSVQCCYEEE